MDVNVYPASILYIALVPTLLLLSVAELVEACASAAIVIHQVQHPLRADLFLSQLLLQPLELRPQVLGFLVLVLPALANEKLATGEFRPNPMAGVPAVSDCDGNGLRDACEILDDPSLDCNDNGMLDSCDLDQGSSDDINADGIPDECQCLADINGSGIVDVDDLLIPET